MKYRNALPQLAGKQMITDGGLETKLIFQDGIDLPLFAAFKALETDAGMKAIETYMDQFAQLAIDTGRGFIMDTPTWRASAKWAAELGVSRESLRAFLRETVGTWFRLRALFETDQCPFVLNGSIGPQDDGYAPSRILTAEQAQTYHAEQIGWFAEFGADMISAITMTYVDEALGVTLTGKAAGLPVVIGFTVETDGRLPSGETLADAIRTIDAQTDSYPAYYMINCAHPDHFSAVLAGDWTRRIMGIRANASRMSHAELDEAEVLDDGDPQELGVLYAELSELLPNLTVIGGCCGTDHRHVAAICAATAI